MLYLNLLLIVLGIYLILIMPRRIDKSYFAKLTGRYYAHRGLFENKGDSPENSLSAFKLAVENDYGIELDVQLTRDNIPIVFHDYDLKRVCAIDKKISDCNYEELKAFKLFDSKQNIPSLQEVLKLVGGQVPLIIELKGEVMEDSICSTVNLLLAKYKGIYIIESFNPYLLRWYKKNRPDIIRGQLSARINRKDTPIKDKLQNFALENFLLNFVSKPHFIAFDHRHTNMLSFNLLNKIYNPFMIAYTIQSQESLDENKDKFDLFIFDGFIPK